MGEHKPVTRYVLVASVGEDDMPVVDLCVADDDGYTFVREAEMDEEFVCSSAYVQAIEVLEESKVNSIRIDREQRERMQATINRLVDENECMKDKISEFIGEESHGESWPPERY